MKIYELEVMNWGDDRYMLITKGHHDIEKFKAECRKEYDHIADYLDKCECPCEQLYYKTIPNKEYQNGYNVPVPKGTRGAFPATVWWE